MPTIDPKGRRRLHNNTAADFANEADARAAADACAALPTAQRAEVWRFLRPRICRWIMASWADPRRGDDIWLNRVAALFYLGGSRFRWPLRQFDPDCPRRYATDHKAPPRAGFFVAGLR